MSKDQSLKILAYRNNFQIINDFWTLEPPLIRLWDAQKTHETHLESGLNKNSKSTIPRVLDKFQLITTKFKFDNMIP